MALVQPRFRHELRVRGTWAVTLWLVTLLTLVACAVWLSPNLAHVASLDATVSQAQRQWQRAQQDQQQATARLRAAAKAYGSAPDNGNRRAALDTATAHEERIAGTYRSARDAYSTAENSWSKFAHPFFVERIAAATGLGALVASALIATVVAVRAGRRSRVTAG